MYNEKQLIKFGLYAERAHRLAFDIALTAAELSQYGKGMANVADETRNIGKKLHSLFDNDKVNEGELLDAVLQLKFLAVNGCLEMMRLHESQLTPKKKLAVMLDELRNLTTDIETVFGLKKDLPLVLPKVTGKNTVISGNMVWSSWIRFVLFEVGGLPFCEAVNNVLEVYYYSVQNINCGNIKIRGEEIPVINLYEKLSLNFGSSDYKPVVIISTEYEEAPQKYTLLVDSIPEIFYSDVGCSTKPIGIQPELVRECWNCEEGRQMLFLNYDNCVQ